MLSSGFATIREFAKFSRGCLTEIIHSEAAARARTGACRPDFERFFGAGMALALAILNAKDSEIGERGVCAVYLERANRNRKCD